MQTHGCHLLTAGAQVTKHSAAAAKGHSILWNSMTLSDRAFPAAAARA